MQTSQMTMDELMAHYTMPTDLQRGELIEGTVVCINKAGAFIDFHSKTEAMVPASELEEIELTPGQTSLFCVVSPADDEQPAVFSAKRAQAFIALRNAKNTNSTITASVLELRRNQSKGIAGIRVRVFGQTGFVPYSMLGVKGKAAETMNGDIQVKVVEDGTNGKLILSQSAVLIEKAHCEQLRQAKVLSALKPDEVVPGKVVRLMPYGAFVEIGNGVRGLLHTSELSNAYRGDVRRDGSRGEPRKVLTINEEMLVKVVASDPGAGRVRLSLKGVQQPRRENVLA